MLSTKKKRIPKSHEVLSGEKKEGPLVSNKNKNSSRVSLGVKFGPPIAILAQAIAARHL